jgi:hypothetical protein
MATFGEFSFTPNSKLKIVPEKQVLHINRSTLKITWDVKGIRFRDKDTNQYVLYIPSFEISGYGATEKKAKEMLWSSTEDFFKYLMNLSVKEMNKELIKFGWKQDRLKKKNYSKVYVDLDGSLKDFNAEEVEFIDLKMTA